MSAINHELVLLRHGKAETEFSGSDFERELTETGLERTEVVADFMREQMLIPDKIISSSAKRALTTANIVCDVLAINSDVVEVRDDLYMADWNDVLKIIQQQAETVKRLLLVGHNPAFEYLADQLSQKSTETLHLSPSSMARLMFNDQWSNLAVDSCQLAFVTHAKKAIEDTKTS